MKKVRFVLMSALLGFLTITLSSSLPTSNVESKETVKEEAKASLTVNPIFKNSISVKTFLSLSAKDIYAGTGKKLSFKEKMGLKFAQRELKTQVKKNQIDENTIVELDKQMGYGESSFNIGGFLLGFILGLIGVGLAHIFSDDKDFRRSSWKGLGAWIILLLVLVLI
jgi:hypothetical protein